MLQPSEGRHPQDKSGAACPTCHRPYEPDRSDKEHNLLFAVIDEAFESWPEQFEFQPMQDPVQGPKHLRGWLAIEAGHMLSADLEGPENITVANVRTLRALLAELGGNDTSVLAMRMVRIPNGIRVIVPKSMARKGPKRIGKREFEQLANKIFELIEAITGTSVEEFKRRARFGAP